MEGTGLVRKLSFWHVWAIGVGAVVGDGIFYLVGQGVETAGPIAGFAYAFAGIIMMIAMLSMCELSVGMPSAGSIHVWSRRILGPSYGTIAGLSYTAMNITFLGSVSIANGIVSNYFFKWTDNATLSAVIWALLLLTIVAGISLAGVAVSGKVQLILVGILTTIMLGFAISGVISGRIDPANYIPIAPFGFAGFLAATGLGVYAYMGPLALLTAGDEIKNVNDLPKAMFWAFITFLIIYTSSKVVMVGLVNYTEFASLESPFTFAAKQIFGRYAGLIMNFAAWLAAFTCLVGEMYCSSRLMYGMAKEGALPKNFSKVHPRTRVPSFSIIIVFLIAIVLVLMGNSQAIESVYLTLCMVGCGLGVICWFITLISASKYKSKYPKEWENISWKLQARDIMFPTAFIGCIVTFYMLFSSDPISLIWTGIGIGAILIYYHTYAKFHMITITQEDNKDASM